MNNLLQIRDKIKRANRLHQAQLLATKNGEVTPYRQSVFEVRITLAMIIIECYFYFTFIQYLYNWTHDMGIGNGILINCTKPLINSYK